MGLEIWTVTALSEKSYTGSLAQRQRAPRARCWGYFATKEKAIDAVKRSPDFFSEHSYYTHVVIERSEEGLLSYDTKATWIELLTLPTPKLVVQIESDGEEFEYTVNYEGVIIDTPDWAISIVGFGIG
jgi:hypothetical protein